MNEKAWIELKDVSIGYGRALLRPLDLTVRQGDFWGFVGPNGAGKTTLVKTVLGLLKTVSGEVRYPQGKPRFGYVPQRHLLNVNYPLSAADIVMMGRTDRIPLGRRPNAEDRRRVREEIERLGLTGIAGKRFGSLSGGQQQRALLARALVGDPDVLVLDEPTTGMDLPGETGILDFLENHHTCTGMTVLMIGHHIGSVVSVADHLCLIHKDADLFEAGPMSEMLTTERLTAAYGRPIEIDRHGRDVLVHAGEANHA